MRVYLETLGCRLNYAEMAMGLAAAINFSLIRSRSGSRVPIEARSRQAAARVARWHASLRAPTSDEVDYHRVLQRWTPKLLHSCPT
jgi:hypothetical protein